MCVSVSCWCGFGLDSIFVDTRLRIVFSRNDAFSLFSINTSLFDIRHHRHNRHTHTHTHTHIHTKEKLCIKRSIINSYCTIKKLKMPTITFVVTRVLLISLLQTTVVEGLASPPPARLKQLLQSEMDGTRESDKPILLPCCYDGLTARLVARAGFDATFMTGFGVSAVNGYPDTQLVSYGEMQSQCNIVAEGLSSAALEIGREPIPCIADGDTGYGNSVNVKRTIFGYGRAGMGGVMIEDQVSPKRCGHVGGKSVVPLNEAISRVKAACDARDEYESQFGIGTGPLILARTDALKTDGFEAAIERCIAFQEAGCDMTFLEAPESVEQMQEYCKRVKGAKLANMLEQGSTPVLSPQELKQMGYTMAAYPLTLLSASIKAMIESLDRIQQGLPTDDIISTFSETKDVVGFTKYASEEQRYKTD